MHIEWMKNTGDNPKIREGGEGRGGTFYFSRNKTDLLQKVFKTLCFEFGSPTFNIKTRIKKFLDLEGWRC